MEQKQTAKAPMSARVTEKTMPLTKWFAEQYYQTFELTDGWLMKSLTYNTSKTIGTCLC